MTSITKQILIAFGIVALLFVVGIGALIGVVLYFTSGKDFDQQYEVKKVEGREFGKTTEQQGCMQEGLKRAKTIKAYNINPVMFNKAFVEECLKASRPTQGFCDGVPSKWNPTSSDWEVKQCDKIRMDELQMGCKAVFDVKVDFCSQ